MRNKKKNQHGVNRISDLDAQPSGLLDWIHILRSMKD